MRTTLYAVVLAIFLCKAQGWPQWGKCPDLGVQQNFQINDYMGLWYCQATYNVDFIQGKGRCTSAQYTYNTTEAAVDVYNRQIAVKSDKWVSIKGTAVPLDASKDEGKLEVTFQVKPWLKVTGPYWVLGTDYSSYSVVYGCKEYFGVLHYYSSWLLSREQNFTATASEDFYNSTSSVLKAHNIDPSIFVTTDQTNCEA